MQIANWKSTLEHNFHNFATTMYLKIVKQCTCIRFGKNLIFYAKSLILRINGAKSQKKMNGNSVNVSHYILSFFSAQP